MRRWVFCGMIALVAAQFMIKSSVDAETLPVNRAEYWRKTYGELPKDDPCVKKAEAVFQRLLRAAGSRPGVTPQLVMLKGEPWNRPLPIALSDGSIILSPKALERCYRISKRIDASKWGKDSKCGDDSKWGDNRLAFVLAHEIAHLLKDDFWHLRFFQAIEGAKSHVSQAKRAELEKLRRQAGSVADKVFERELQADESGIIYAAMAGFQTHAIVTEDDQVNFFADWILDLHPLDILNITPGRGHPSPSQRAENVKASPVSSTRSSGPISDGVGGFTKWVNTNWLSTHLADSCPQFPSREVYHNLAASHHRLALQYAALQKGLLSEPLFHLSVAIDAGTRARHIVLRDKTDQTSKKT